VTNTRSSSTPSALLTHGTETQKRTIT
jgi:hypothetical protein